MPKTKKSPPDSDPPRQTFTSTEVSRFARVSLRQLQWWDERRLVSPRHQSHRRVYLPQQVLEVTVIAELRRKGFSLQKIRRFVRALDRQMGRRLSDVLSGASDLHLLTDGKSLYLEDRQERVIDLLKNSRQPMFLVCVSDQVRRLGRSPRKAARVETSLRVRKARTV